MPTQLSLFRPDAHEIEKAAFDVLRRNRRLTFALASTHPSTPARVYTEISAELAAVARIGVTGPIIDGWRLNRRLRDAARASLHNPEHFPVELASYRVTWHYPHELDVIINGMPRATLHADVDVDVTIAKFTGIVRGGWLVEVRGGDAQALCTLTLERIAIF